MKRGDKRSIDNVNLSNKRNKVIKKYHIEFQDPTGHPLMVFVEATNSTELRMKISQRLLAEYYDIVCFKAEINNYTLEDKYGIAASDSVKEKQLKVWRVDKPYYRTISVKTRSVIQYSDKCNGCLNESLGQNDHMGINGCLNTDFNL